jgi:hypothetical protein
MNARVILAPRDVRHELIRRVGRPLDPAACLVLAEAQHDVRGEQIGGVLAAPKQRHRKISKAVPGLVQGPEQKLADDRVMPGYVGADMSVFVILMMFCSSS